MYLCCVPIFPSMSFHSMTLLAHISYHKDLCWCNLITGLNTDTTSVPHLWRMNSIMHSVYFTFLVAFFWKFSFASSPTWVPQKLQYSYWTMQTFWSASVSFLHSFFFILGAESTSAYTALIISVSSLTVMLSSHSLNLYNRWSPYPISSKSTKPS